MDSLLERLALDNPKVASARGALGLRQQVTPCTSTRASNGLPGLRQWHSRMGSPNPTSSIDAATASKQVYGASHR